MKRLIVTMLILAALVSTAAAQDVREAARRAQAEREAAEAAAAAAEQRILEDRTALTGEVARLEGEQARLESEVADLERRERRGKARLEELEKAWGQSELEFREISGNVRLSARDLETALEQSPFTALAPERLARISPILRKGYFPDIDDIAGMVDVYFDEAARSGQVSLQEGAFVGRDGEDTTGRIMTLGRFTAVYQDGDETGFLRYAPAGHKFFALSTLPSGSIRRELEGYLAGDGESVTIDMSGGAALRQITHRQTFRDQLQAGGPIVYPMALLALTGLLIIVYKIFQLNRVGKNTDKYMGRVNALASKGNWDECEAIVKRHKGEHSPVNHVIEAGLTARHEDRETLESVLQEAILSESPRLERGLSTLAIIGAVAPLLGLLGTVTGMIDTFRVITLFGTGDPKLMSGGISEALVTTELGLAVAIPIMLLHTFLSRRADGIIGDMEEKAVSLTNIIHKERARNARSAVAGG